MTGDKRIRTDFVVGDRYGTSCRVEFVEALEKAMRARSFMVQRNKPYAGGYITEHYGAPARGYHAVQIEINRALYMEEREKSREAPRSRRMVEVHDRNRLCTGGGGHGAATQSGRRMTFDFA